MSEKSSNKLVSPKTGVVMMLAAPVLVVLPFFAAITLGRLFCGPDANESNCGWSALPWLTFITLPAGFVLFVAGFVVLIISLVKKTGSKKDV